MKTSDTVAAIHEAIAKVQAAIEPIAKNKAVKVEGEKARWESNYATLATLDAAVRPALIEHGIAVMQSTDFLAGAGFVLVTRLALGAEWIESVYPIKPSRDGSQGFGGGISFARRWGLCGVLNLVPDDIEEGQGYADAKREGKAPRRQAAPGGLGAVLESIRGSTLDTIVTAARKARAEHPAGEASAAVEKTIEAWFVATCDACKSLDTHTTIRDLANTIKPRGTDVRNAIQRAGAAVEPK